ncbi:MAG: 1,4-alpha-glucan branching protein GlgB [Lachnospiraceae bacterium]|nr:1,4-alpha-glucan branching protein GlgB [Lachnospiraceae bacterium]
MDHYGFYTGKILDAYEYFGCHLTEDGAVFRTFAPAAKKICVIGEFNNWNETEMKNVYNNHFWECNIEGVKAGMMYKFRIYKNDGTFVDHCDPYGYGMELRPMCASIVRDMNKFMFNDQKWMNSRNNHINKPLNIYEVHLGSWRNNKDNENGWYSYSEIADQLIMYVKDKGYNYIELMPIGEHPCDNSWGYQQTGFYAPTSRYGDCDGLKDLINRCHNNGIGVILDFVPVHFAVDGYGLAKFDGTHLYEYPNDAVGVSQWGSHNFNHSRGEVQCFLQSAANYWLSEYHFDGLRIDALSNIIYWHGDKNRGVNNNAVEYIKYMNKSLKEKHKGIMLIAEDSTSYPGVTKSVEEGGLGFDYKWDMGWMNDTLEYFKLSPEDRKGAYHKLTFSMMYNYNENFIMPLSHDEVVHGKATILQKMYGDLDNKFPQARAMYMYMYTHPGKMLNFMGNEIGQLREWDERREQDWNITEFPLHKKFEIFMKDLNTLYLKKTALWADDHNTEGFKWIDCHQEEKCIYALERRTGNKRIVALFNFSDKVTNYELKVDKCTCLSLCIDSNETKYGGDGANVLKKLYMVDGKVSIDVAPYSGKIFEVNYSI